MEEIKSLDLLEFRGLMAAIQTESASLQKELISEDIEKEASEILSEFDNKISTLAFSTLNNMVLYQTRGWRVLFD